MIRTSKRLPLLLIGSVAIALATFVALVFAAYLKPGHIVDWLATLSLCG